MDLLDRHATGSWQVILTYWYGPDLFNYTSPLFSSIGAATTPVYGNDLNTVRMLSVLFGSLTVPFLYLFGKEMYNRETGLLAAILLCFSVYHSLYSRIIMLEATAIFFITACVYFFWRTQHPKEGQNRVVSAILAGSLMGLAIDVKYAALFLVPVILGYILWTSGFDFWALFEKRILIGTLCAFLFFLPLLFCLFYTGVGFHGMLYYTMEKYEKPLSEPPFIPPDNRNCSKGSEYDNGYLPGVLTNYPRLAK